MKRLTSKSTVAEVKRTVAEIIKICNQYNFWDREASPYSFRMTVRELVESKGWKEYEYYTTSSKGIIRSEINGFIEILEHWVAYQNEPTIRIHFLQGAYAGQIRDEKSSLAEIFIQTQMAELA